MSAALNNTLANSENADLANFIVRSTKINPQVRTRIEKERAKQLERLAAARAPVEGEEEKVEGAGGEEELKDDIMMILNEKKKIQEESVEQENERVKEDAHI